MIESTITELADKLGKAMASAQRTQRFKQIRSQVLADPAAQALLKDYEGHLDVLARREAENKPIEVADKHRLSDLQEKIFSNEKLKSLMAAQADYMELIQQVNEAIGKHLLDPHETAPGTPQPKA